VAHNKSEKKSVDHYINLGEYYKIIFEHTDLAQRIVDYAPISLAQLSQPLDHTAKVFGVESGWVARSDFHRNPHRFTLDIHPKAGEDALLRPRMTRVRVLDVVGQTYTISHNGTTSFNIERKFLEKIGGVIPLNVVVFDDASEVFQQMVLQYSDTARTEEPVNIASKHRRRPEFCALLGLVAGGKKTFNVNERNVIYERQRRALSTEGVVLPRLEVRDEHGNVIVLHDTVLYRNEFCRVLDDPEFVAQGGLMSHRNPNSLGPLMENFKACLANKTTAYCYLLNQNLQPRDEESSRNGYAKAESLRGTPGWKKNAMETGFKWQMLAEKGSDMHGLPPDPTQNQYKRIDHERMHALGIVTGLFREFLISQLDKSHRTCLLYQPAQLRQPAGTHQVVPLTVKDKEGRISYKKSGEKLHQKKHWREHRMLSDLYPRFPEGHPMRQVFIFSCVARLLLTSVLLVSKDMVAVYLFNRTARVRIHLRRAPKGNCSEYKPPHKLLRSLIHRCVLRSLLRSLRRFLRGSLLRSLCSLHRSLLRSLCSLRHFLRGSLIHGSPSDPLSIAASSVPS
jgi:hypothetical protein